MRLADPQAHDCYGLQEPLGEAAENLFNMCFTGAPLEKKGFRLPAVDPLPAPSPQRLFILSSSRAQKLNSRGVSAAKVRHAPRNQLRP